MSNLLLGIILGLWSGVAMVLDLSGLGVRTPILTAILAGLCVGDMGMALKVGSVMLINSLGFYTYGGATIPDFITGSIFGTVIGAQTQDWESGVVVASSISLLMTQMDILGRSTTTVFQHLGEASLAKNNIKRFELDTILGVLPWALSRMLPVIIGMLGKDAITKLVNFAESVKWIQSGLTAVGGALPAVGFALLLSYMDLKKYWMFFIAGLVLYTFTGMGTFGLALVGLAAAGLYVGGAK